MKEIFVDLENNYKNIYFIQDYEIIEKYSENLDNPMIEGNIYVGKVQNVLPGMQAAFVNIGNHRNAFIHLKELLPKEDILSNKEVERPKDIRKLIKPGDAIIVQVTRDENLKKGAKLTSHISLNGRFFIYMPNTPFVVASQKIEDESKKEELKKLASENIPEGTGGIIRTNAANISKEELLAEINSLCNNWEEITKIQADKIPMELYNAGGIINKFLTNSLSKDIDKIYVKNSQIKKEVENNLKKQELKIEVQICEDYLSKFDYQKQISKIDNRKIWLKCGGFITIDKTEALTAIDVNSGKYIGTKDLEQTVYTVNKEASIEIAKQLRLRDIGGIIIIDYIDMEKQQTKQKVLETLEEALKKDRSKTQVIGFTPLDLLEMTRKHMCSND